MQGRDEHHRPEHRGAQQRSAEEEARRREERAPCAFVLSTARCLPLFSSGLLCGMWEEKCVCGKGRGKKRKGDGQGVGPCRNDFALLPTGETTFGGAGLALPKSLLFLLPKSRYVWRWRRKVVTFFALHARRAPLRSRVTRDSYAVVRYTASQLRTPVHCTPYCTRAPRTSWISR